MDSSDYSADSPGEECKVIHCKLVRDKYTGGSLGYAYLTFETDEQANLALDLFNFTKIYGRVIRISYTRERAFVSRPQRNHNNNLYIKNLDLSIDSHELFQLFKEFGAITSARVMEQNDGRSKGFGFVCFHSGDDAQRAIDAMNTLEVKGKPLHVSIALANSGKGSYAPQMGYANSAAYRGVPPTQAGSPGLSAVLSTPAYLLPPPNRPDAHQLPLNAYFQLPPQGYGRNPVLVPPNTPLAPLYAWNSPGGSPVYITPFPGDPTSMGYFPYTLPTPPPAHWQPSFYPGDYGYDYPPPPPHLVSPYTQHHGSPPYPHSPPLSQRNFARGDHRRPNLRQGSPASSPPSPRVDRTLPAPVVEPTVSDNPPPDSPTPADRAPTPPDPSGE